MGCNVFANNNEISCKTSAGKVTATLPDVCLSPPSPPAGPVPIPYPVSSFASDCSDGSKTVKINDQEIMLKDKSYFKKCTGDEAATQSLGQGVVSHTITGKVYFVSWSMDVEVEGENVVRHLDMTTSNHGSPISNASVPWPELAEMAFGPGGKCEGVTEELKLQKYSKDCPPDADGNAQTGHHLIPGRCLRNEPSLKPDYSHSAAPVICVSQGNQHQGSHKLCHNVFDPVELKHAEEGKPFDYATARETAAASAGQALDPPRELSKKEKDCVSHQLDQYYTAKPPQGPGCTNSTPLAASGPSGKAIPAETPEEDI